MGFSVRHPFSRRLLHQVILFFIAVTLSFAIAQPGLAQFSLPEAFQPGWTIDPPSLVTRYGNIETIAVRSPLSNRNLFTITSSTIYDRSADESSNRLPVEQRAKEIQDKLLLLLERNMDPETLELMVSQLNNVTVITVRDKQYPQPLVLTSVTISDAEFNGLPRKELAEQWRKILEADLRNGLLNLPQNRQRVYRMLAGLIAITALVLAVKYLLLRQQRQLRQQKRAYDAGDLDLVEDRFSSFHPSTPEQEVEQQRSDYLQKFQQGFVLDRRLSTLDLIQWLLFWLMLLAWYGGAVWVFAVSPYLLANSLGFLDKLISLLTIWFLTGLTIRLSRRLIDYLSVEREGLDLGDFLTYGDEQRRQMRASTIAGAIKGLITIVIALVGGLLALSKLGVPTASVLAIGSLAGLALSFGSQNLIKDLVNGFFILAEDQYAVGDVINIGTDAGLVEELNMRVTQIRSPDGELITIPNSTITKVKNLTRSWSRVAITLDVAYQTDPDKVLKVLRNLCEQFYNDPEWQDKLVGEPEVLGIDNLSHSGMTIAIWIKMVPAQRWAASREFRLRIRRALAEHGIEIGVPWQIYKFSAPSAEERDTFQENCKR